MSHAFQNPARRWDVLAGFMRQNGFKHFVEVGCKEGRVTGAILGAMPYAKVWAIDPWVPMPAQAAVEDGETYEDWDFEEIERIFWENVGKHADRLEFHRATSLEVAARFRLMQEEKKLPKEIRKGFDLVFIDAAHDQDSVRADIKAWWPLVREGGFLAGHDYQHKFPGVIRAVAESFPLMRVGLMPDSVWMVMKAEDIEP